MCEVKIIDKNKTRIKFWLYKSLPVLVCMALVAVIYYPVFFMGYWAVNGSDALHIHLPCNYILVRELSRGKFPLWNPNFNLGQPISAGFTPIFHPAIIFYLFFSPWLANTMEVLIGLALTFLGIWYFLRQQELSIFPAAVGTIVYVMSGPVFFLHSYHLGFMAILLLPWCLYVFHQHDRTGDFKWLCIAAFFCILAVQSLDLDTLLYLYIAFVIDRFVCLPVSKRGFYITRWLFILLLSTLTGALSFLPLYESLKYSSRLTKSYFGILNPSLSNVLTAILTNQWLKDWPYDVSYFYFGPAVIWLALAGLARFDKVRYIFRYFSYILVVPLFYIIIRFLQSYNPGLLGSLDVWRCMFIFCLGLAMVVAVGVGNILKGQRFQHLLALFAGLSTSALAIWAIASKMHPKTFNVLLITTAGILITAFPFLKASKMLQLAGISTAIIATLMISIISRTVSIPSCAWNFTVVNFTCQPPYIQCNSFMRNLPFYRALNKTQNGKDANWRISLLGGTDNMTALACLSTLPNYSTIYSKDAENAFSLDGLVNPSNIHPYWMKLQFANSNILSFYGVRFLVGLGNQQSAKEDVGWIERLDLSWPDHRVWENKYYIGRAYIVTPQGERKGGVEFIQDTPTLISLRAETEDGDRLVLADLNYPGWEAFIDGKSVSTQVYHRCLRSVTLSKGMHIVYWRYDNRMQRIGLILSLTALLFLICFLIILQNFAVKNKTIHKRTLL